MARSYTPRFVDTIDQDIDRLIREAPPGKFRAKPSDLPTGGEIDQLLDDTLFEITPHTGAYQPPSIPSPLGLTPRTITPDPHYPLSEEEIDSLLAATVPAFEPTPFRGGYDPLPKLPTLGLNPPTYAPEELERALNPKPAPSALERSLRHQIDTEQLGLDQDRALINLLQKAPNGTTLNPDITGEMALEDYLSTNGGTGRVLPSGGTAFIDERERDKIAGRALEHYLGGQNSTPATPRRGIEVGGSPVSLRRGMTLNEALTERLSPEEESALLDHNAITTDGYYGTRRALTAMRDDELLRRGDPNAAEKLAAYIDQTNARAERRAAAQARAQARMENTSPAAQRLAEELTAANTAARLNNRRTGVGGRQSVDAVYARQAEAQRGSINRDLSLISAQRDLARTAAEQKGKMDLAEKENQGKIKVAEIEANGKKKPMKFDEADLETVASVINKILPRNNLSELQNMQLNMELSKADTNEKREAVLKSFGVELDDKQKRILFGAIDNLESRLPTPLEETRSEFAIK